jgi:hypothetical protein
MNDGRPIITFHASVPTKASPEAVYDLLADVNTHLEWAGKQAPSKSFRLLTLDAPSEPATVGTRFSSTGANGTDPRDTFHDRSVVVVAEPASRFGFDTESSLSRKRRPTWRSRFAHRYSIEPSGGGAVIAYTCEVRPQNYIPYWLKPWFRPMTRVMVGRMMAKHMRNLARMAEGAREGDTAGR